MNEPDQPQKVLKPSMSAEELVDVLDEATALHQEAADALQRQADRCLNNQPHNLQSIKDCTTIGRFSRVIGIRDLIRGTAIEVQRLQWNAITRNEDLIKRLVRRAPQKNAPMVEKFMRLSIDHFKVINESLKLLLEAEGSLAALPSADPLEAPVHTPFKPGQQIVPPSSGTLVVTQQAHFHPQTDKHDQK